MTVSSKRIPDHLQVWIEACRRFHLSHAQVQMARELCLNPKKLGKLANHRQEPWKLPLTAFIERIYYKQFGKSGPRVVLSIEARARNEAEKKAARRTRRLAQKSGPERAHHDGPDGRTDVGPEDEEKVDERGVPDQT